MNTSKANTRIHSHHFTIFIVYSDLLCPAASLREFLQHYLLVPTAIREVPPGEAVFNLDKFGCVFDHNTLQLKKCVNVSQCAVQKILLT